MAPARWEIRWEIFGKSSFSIIQLYLLRNGMFLMHKFSLVIGVDLLPLSERRAFLAAAEGSGVVL